MNYNFNNKNNIKFVNNIKYFTREQYEQLRKKYASKLKDISGIISIYNCGNIDTPGISDLDFLVITDNNGVDWSEIKKIHSSFTKNEKYIIGNHYPYFVKKEIALNINAILPLSNLNHVWGFDKLIHHQLSSDDYFFILGEVIINFYPSVFISSLQKKILYLREEIVKLKSSRFVIYYSQKLGLNSKICNDYLNNVEFICKNYFSMNIQDLQENICLSINKFLAILEEIIHFMDSKIQSKFKLNYKNTINVHTNTIFKNLKKSNYISKAKSFHKFTGRIMNYYPQSFGIFSYDNFKLLKINQSEYSYFDERMKLIKEHSKFYKDNNIGDLIVYDAYHHFQDKKPIKEILMKVFKYL